MRALARSGNWLRILAIVLAFANLALWYIAPWLRDFFDATTGRLASPLRPMVLNGVQELLVYYDPWLAFRVFPVVYTLGFVAIALLFQPAPTPSGPISGSAVVSVLLLSFEAVWLLLLAVTIFFRGPNWNFYWPWEAWNPKLVPLNTVNFSLVFWRYVAGLQVPPTPWIVRESPGLLLAAAYFSLGLLIARLYSRGTGCITVCCCFVFLMLFALAPLCLRKITILGAGNLGVKASILLLIAVPILAVSYPAIRLLRPRNISRFAIRPMSYWRCVLLVLLMQLSALVPVKVLLYWAFDLKYFIHISEYFVNF